MRINAFNHYWLIRWYWLVLFLLALSLLVGLSLWQLQRATEKTTILSRMDAWQQKRALDIVALKNFFAESPTQSVDAAPVEFKARWLAPYVWLLDNKIVKGRVGYDVVIPVLSFDDSLGQQADQQPAVLVNLGWIEAPRSRADLPKLMLPNEFSIRGIFRTQVSGVLLGQNVESKNQWPMRAQQIDLSEFSRQLGIALLSGVIYQQGQSPFELHYKPVVMSPEKHRAYAVQWALLALALMVITVIASAHKSDALKEVGE
jgi:surfeit locus 1 family protein